MRPLSYPTFLPVTSSWVPRTTALRVSRLERLMCVPSRLERLMCGSSSQRRRSSQARSRAFAPALAVYRPGLLALGSCAPPRVFPACFSGLHVVHRRGSAGSVGLGSPLKRAGGKGRGRPIDTRAKSPGLYTGKAGGKARKRAFTKTETGLIDTRQPGVIPWARMWVAVRAPLAATRIPRDFLKHFPPAGVFRIVSGLREGCALCVCPRGGLQPVTEYAVEAPMAAVA